VATDSPGFNGTAGQREDRPGTLAALGYFALGLLAGLLVAMQLVNHNPLRGWELFSPAAAHVHTNAVAYGFLANAFWACSTGSFAAVQPAGAERAAVWFIFVPGRWSSRRPAASLPRQGVEWGETPVWIDPLAGGSAGQDLHGPSAFCRLLPCISCPPRVTFLASR
jgi:cytochrome c oxidase cbb3-type subunit 1